MAENSPLQDLKTVALQQAALLWRRKWLAIAICWVVCAVGWTVVGFLPRHYESSSRVYVDVNGLLTPLLKGMVVESGASQSEQYLRETLLSRPNLEEAAVLTGVDVTGMSRVAKEELIDHLAAHAVVQGEGQNLVGISYTGKTPKEARDMTQALLTIFAEKASSSSRVEMEKARKFLDSQVANYGAQLHAAEQRRADFRKQYADYLPDAASGTPRLEVLEQQIMQLKQQYAQAQITASSLAAQLRLAPQLLSVASAPIAGPDGRLVAASPEMRLMEAQRSLAELRLHYTDQHPDVRASQRDVAELQDQVAAARRSGAAAGNAQISNPVYEQTRMKYIDAQTTLPIAKQRLDDAIADYKKVKALANDLPDIEAKGANFDRDYGILRANYEELVKRREAASLSQAADDQADRTQFRVVDPPLLPLNPSFPNVPLMVSVVLFLGLMIGAGIPLAITKLHPTYLSVAQLRELGLPVIGTISLLRRGLTGNGFLRQAFAPAACMAVLGTVYIGLIVVGTGVYRWFA